MRLFTYLRHQFYYHRLLKYQDDTGWRISLSMILCLQKCLETIPEDQYSILTRNQLQTWKFQTHLKNYSRWVEAMDEAINVVQSGGEFPMQYQRYGTLRDVDLFTYFDIQYPEKLREQLRTVSIKCESLLKVLDYTDESNYSYYVRIVKKLLAEGIDILILINQKYKESNFE